MLGGYIVQLLASGGMDAPDWLAVYCLSDRGSTWQLPLTIATMAVWYGWQNVTVVVWQ
jgi:hypothetical protein